MPRIPEDVIQRVRDAVDIVDVIGDHVTLTKRGRSHLGLCPFHDDHSPSMNVSQDKQIYKCFSCGAGGNVYTFLTELERISFAEAVRQMADGVGIEIPEGEAGPSNDQQEAFDQLYAINDLARKYYNHILLNDPAGKQALEYLTDRGITGDLIEAFSLGAAPNTWDGFLRMASAPKRGYKPPEIERAGLILRRNDGTGHYDRFRHRVIFPIHSRTGRTVAFGARALDPNERAKYLNSPETPIYHKSNELYGLWEGRDDIRKADQILLVEGYTDVLSMVQAGIRNVAATSGTALTDAHARLIKRYAQKVILVFDGDTAGQGAAARGIDALFAAGLETNVVTLPDNDDPDSFVRKRGAEAFSTLTTNAQPILQFLVQSIALREDLSTVDGRARAAEILAAAIARVRDETRRGLFVQQAAEMLRVDETIIAGAVSRAARRPAQRSASGDPAPRPVRSFDPRPRSERELLLRMMADETVADHVLSQIHSDEFTNSVYRGIAALMGERRKTSLPVEVAVLVDVTDDPELAHVLSAMAMENGAADPEALEVPVQDYIDTFRIRAVDLRIEATVAEMKQAEGDRLKELLQQHRDLSVEHETLLGARKQAFEAFARANPTG